MNIEILTQTELLELSGDPGHFTARVQTHPRFVDLAKCTSCGECAKVCPVELPNEYDEGLSPKRAAYKRYAQAIPGAFAIHKSDPAPCRTTCPAGINVQGYVQMVKTGNYEAALKIIMQQLPLPGVLGRICPHPCEEACRRLEVDQAVAIRDLKRLAADQFDPRQIEIACAPRREEKVAIIGSGPAGLSAAYHLAVKGIGSTIFEALSEAGGMLRVGIPDHRLPREVLDREIEVITELGVEIKTSTPLGPDLAIDDLLRDGYKSVYLALGAHKPMALGITGETSHGVTQGVDFLREVNLTGKTQLGNRVAIIGGGNVAIDVSRAAVRLGAKEVQILYRRTRAEMPAWEEEIEAAESEGVKITYLVAPTQVLHENGRVSGVRCVRMQLGEPDRSGRRRPVPINGSEFDLEIDQLIPAIGQRPDLTAIEKVTGLEFTRYHTVTTDDLSCATGRPGVFAGGDLVTGPATVIEAVAAGKAAAESIRRYLDGEDLRQGRQSAVPDEPALRPISDKTRHADRTPMPHLPVSDRAGNFAEVELGYQPEQGTQEAERCLNCGYCCECEQCVPACLAEAIDHTQQAHQLDLEVGSVILCAGSEPFDPSGLSQFYRYQHHPNVLTSLEFERILSASGPTMGHLQRPSDEQVPQKIAWLQCIGSRDTNRCGNGYCSSVCCMYAIKDAMIAKEHAHGDLECTIFNMDIRTFGKEYEKYYLRAKEKAGVRFVKARVHTIVEADGDNLILQYVDETGQVSEETFDMVVLSVGLQIPQSTVTLADRLGIELGPYRFIDSPTLAPVTTSRPGVFACGVLQEPKDIPSSVTEASAAACLAGGALTAARHTCTHEVTLPDPIDVSGEPPRIGVFVCNCGINISGVVDVAQVEEYAGALPDVVYVGQNLFSCSQDSQEKMKELIKEHQLNRIVVAACTPKTHEAIFMDTLEAVGLNKYLFEMANIRNQDSWVHADDPEQATVKAKALVQMAVARAANLHPLEERKIPVIQRALVVGGGVAGMHAALGLADQGYEVVLVEKEERLGGLANRLLATIEGDDIQAYLAELVERVNGHQQHSGAHPLADRRFCRL